MQQKLFTQIKSVSEPFFKNLYSWNSPDRYWVKKERSWYVLYSLFFVLIIALLALLGEYILILAVLSFVFLWFVQASVSPNIVEHIITTIGIKTLNKLYTWENIRHFWFSVKNGEKFLNLDIIPDSKPNSKFLKRLTLLVEDKEKEIFEILIKHLTYGDKEEVGFNVFTYILYGEHLDITFFLPEEDNLTSQNYFKKRKNIRKLLTLKKQ